MNLVVYACGFALIGVCIHEITTPIDDIEEVEEREEK